MLELSPFALRLLKASFNAAEDGLAGHPAAGPRRQPPLLRERGGAGGPRRLPGEAPAGLREVPEAAVSGASAERRLRAARQAVAARGAAAHAARPRSRPCWWEPRWPATEDDFRPLPVRRRADRQRVHPDRHEPLERLLGRAPRRRHRGAARAGARDRRRADAAATGAGRAPTSRSASPWRPALYLAAVAGWELLVVGAASILAGVLYTGGPRPYGYEGLGELFVFLFFGIVAVVGSYFVQTEDLRWEAFALARAGRAARRGDPRGEQRARHRHRPPRRASARWRCKLGRERARMLFVAMVVGRLRRRRRRPGPSAASRPGCCSRSRRCRWRRR